MQTLKKGDRIRMLKKSENSNNFFELPFSKCWIKSFSFPKKSCEASYCLVVGIEYEDVMFEELLPINAPNFKIIKY